MKNSGKCPKCGERSILRIPGSAGAYGSGNNITVGLTVFSSIKVTRFMCEACGFSEEWVEDPSDRAKLRDKYDRDA